MTQLDVKTLCLNITETFRVVPELKVIQDINDITDSIPPGDMPLLMVYPNETEGSSSSETQGKTFGGGANRPVQIEDTTISIDVYIGIAGGVPLRDILAQLIDVWNALNEIIRAQTIQPYFGDSQIKSFQWTMTRSELRFAGVPHYGISIDLSVREF